MAGEEIYLDNAATTRVDKRVVKEMERFYLEEYGNPSSAHKLGEKAAYAMNNARAKIAEEINAKPQEIIFTSGTTESNNLAFFGLARNISCNLKKNKIIISAIEHSSIFEICEALKKEGFEIVQIPVDKNGFVDLEKLENEVDNKTLLVSIIHVNNEIGVIQEIERIGELCFEKSVIFHTDCAQSFGKLPLDVKKMKIGLLSAGAHKIGGPKGIGFLYVNEKIEILPLIYGGGQEKGLRGGTENVPAIIGFAKALELYKKINKKKILNLRDYFIESLEKIGARINGSKERRIYDNINACFPGVEGENIAAFLSQRGIYVSSGSACESKNKKESRVLKAIGLNDREIKNSIRITLNDKIDVKEINIVLKHLEDIISKFKNYNIHL